MIRALVTGGAGFIGSHLCERLLADGCEVIALDDLSTGSRTNLQHLLGRDGFRFVEHDVVEPYNYETEWIFNLASPASPNYYQRDPTKTLTTNVLGTLNGLTLASLTGARFFQASTSEVYGDPSVHPQREDYLGNVDCTGPRACYDEGKRCAETLAFDHHRTVGVDIRVARIFNTYGPRMAVDDGRVVSNFIVQALRDEDITIYGDGEQTRSFCYVDDLVDGCVRMMRGAERGPLNLGNPAELTIRELAVTVIALTRSKSRLRSLALPKDDPRRRQPDVRRAELSLGFAPSVSLRKGLEPTIADFVARLSRPSP